MEDVTADAIARIQAAMRAKGAPEDMLERLPDEIPFRLLREEDTSMHDGMYVIARDDGSEVVRLSWGTSPEEVPALMGLIQLAIHAFAPTRPPTP